MKITTYNSLLTGKRTTVIVSLGKTGHSGYKEIQIRRIDNMWVFKFTDGYNTLQTGTSVNPNLKSVINILEGYAKKL